MKGNSAVIIAYALGLGLMLGYAALVWSARRRAARRIAREAAGSARARETERLK